MIHRFIALAGCVLGLAAHAESQLPLFPGEKWGAAEDAIAQEILATSIATARQNKADGIVRRDAHPKQHGCVRARWRTADLVSQVGRDAGLFSESGAEYDAWLRFSNGAPGGAHASDADADVRGLAIKLLGVPNTPRGSQDFVMMSSPRFFSRDAADYLDFHRAVVGGKASLALYLATHWTNAAIIYKARVTPANPLEMPYFAPVPARLGDSSMRMKVEPCGSSKSYPETSSPNFLKERLVDSLGREAACFNVYVQPNENPARNLVEDPRLEWDKAESPFHLAGQITIPRQEGIDSASQWAFCENVSFDPWNTQSELRPLGQINRIRKLVYEGVARYRREENGVTAPAEPVNLEPCETSATRSLCQTR